MDATTLLERLQMDGPAAPVRGLAELSVDALLDAPLNAWLAPEALAGWLQRLVAGALASEGTEAALARTVEALVEALRREPRSVEAMLPLELRRAVREVVRRPFSPDRRLVLSLIDREPFRELVREILVEAVLEFGRRASAPVAGVAKGLGTLARIAQESVRARSGPLGSLVGAVGSEVERQLEKRAVEFVDAALSGVLGQLADAVADPRRADEAAQLRLALLDGAWTVTGPQLARELMNADVPGAAALLRRALGAWVSSEAAGASFNALATLLVSSAGTQTVREQLAALGLLEAARPLAVEQLTARLRHVVATPAFAAWLAALAG